MTDVMLLWDSPLLFEKLFAEHGIKCQRITAETIGTPFLPPCKCLVVPTGFANPAYTKVLGGLRRSKKQIERFVEKGGIVLAFGPMVEGHDFDWLPMELKYVQKQMSADICKAKDESQCIVDKLEGVEFDGYLKNAEGDVLLTDKKGRALMVSKKTGDGMIIVTTIHEFPSGDFLKWVLQKAKSTRL
ncbi:hypothetical protein [Methanolobus chelungpuianus]|uniref:Uncharacterized protein n=1 Tax=Methanolobus chelungpuianus TaxID=502115 RepID=A0AAE3KX90_9EURY|nr:hypothetical protein [Methanolobus chelungpuianus]MCQ6962677.1 hypothetical protein [Methanolobus chelungpuianus]